MFLVTSVDVRTANIECHGECENVDESEDVWFIVHDGDVLQSFIQHGRDGLD